MKIKLLLVLMLISLCYLTAQEIHETENIEILEFSDSLEIVFESDSLSGSRSDSNLILEPILPDTLQLLESVIPDSLDSMMFNLPDSLNIESSFLDTLDVEKLFDDLQEFLTLKKKLRYDFQLPMIIEKEDFHLKTPFNSGYHFTKNGFTHYPYLVSDIHVIQSFTPLENAVYDQGFIDFTMDNYSFPVASTEVFLGLGDIEMKHAAANYKKGNIIGIPNLNLEISYAGMDGRWLGEREKSRNFDGHIFYISEWGRFHFYISNLDQEISSLKTTDPPDLFQIDTIRDWNSSSAFKWENPFLNIGYRSESAKIGIAKRKLSEYWFNKDLKYRTHLLNLTYEYFDNSTSNDNFNVFSLKQNSEVSLITFENRVSYQDKNEYIASSHLKAKLISYFQLQGYFEKKDAEATASFWQTERLGAGFIIKLPKLDITVLGGNDKIEEEDITFLESRVGTDFDIGILNIGINNWSLYRRVNSKYIPDLQTQTSLEFQLNMKNENFIKLGLSHIFISEYAYLYQNFGAEVYSSFSHFNAWLAIQITKQFQIKLDAVNLTNELYLFGWPTSEDLAGRHFNFNVQWTFIN